MGGWHVSRPGGWFATHKVGLLQHLPRLQHRLQILLRPDVVHHYPSLPTVGRHDGQSSKHGITKDRLPAMRAKDSRIQTKLALAMCIRGGACGDPGPEGGTPTPPIRPRARPRQLEDQQQSRPVDRSVVPLLQASNRPRPAAQ